MQFQARVNLSEQLASKAEFVINNLQQTDYQHNEVVEAAKGIYRCDCSGFVGLVLDGSAPKQYAMIPKETNQPRPRAFEYYSFFASLTAESAGGWRRVKLLQDVQRGDMIAWRFAQVEAGKDTGHVFFVAEPPVILTSDIVSIRVYDSADVPHFDDTRGDEQGQFPNGVGSGVINFMVDENGGPASFQFGPSETKWTVLPIAIGRIESSDELSKRLVGYFPANAKDFDYSVPDIPADQLTHVIYAFAAISAAGECVSGSPASDKVNFPELLQLKQQHPQLLTLISVGGATSSTGFTNATSSSAGISKLALSCVQYMRAHEFDGIDIDWEFPTAAQTQIYTALLMALRRELDAQGAADNRSYLLTIAAPAGPSNYKNIDLPQIYPQLDWINLETYDFAVPSSKTTNFVAPLFAAKDDPAPPESRAAHNVDAAVKAYVAAGVPPDKLLVGVRFIGTGWRGVAKTDDGLYQSDAGPAKGTWDKTGSSPSGSFFYQDIKDNYIGKYLEFRHPDADVPWLYSPTTGIMISYEDPQSVGDKADYAVSNKLGGIMVWQLAADDQEASLVSAIAGKLAVTPLSISARA